MDRSSRSFWRITTLVVLFPVLVLLLYGALMYLYFMYAQHRDTRWEIVQYETRLMDTEVSNLEEKVRNMAQYIRYYDSQSATRIQKDVKKIVHAATGVVRGILEGTSDRLPRAQAETIALKALGNIRFEEGVGYLFVIDTHGKTLLHNDPKLIGKTTIDLQDSNGKYIIRSFIETARNPDGGFVDYYWYIPGSRDRSMHYKISYVQQVPGTDWILGAGEYLRYMRRFIQKDMLAYLRSNGRFEDGYFFVTDSAGHTIYHPEGNATADADRYLIEGAYRDERHIAYTEYIAQYDWYVTAVKNIRRVQERIEEQKAHLVRLRSENVRASFWIMGAMLLLSLLLSLSLSSVINRRLRTYEEQLHESNEKLLFQSRQALIGELLPMIAHQWRQPINKIASVLAVLRFGISEGKCDPKEVDKACENMEESVEFMSETIDDFRTFYRPKNETETVDLSHLITKAIEFVDASIRHKDIRLSTHLRNIQYRLYANEFLQVMINLIKNAVDASPKQGTIDIALYEHEGVIRIVVTDHGEGIAPEALGKIFEPYFSTKENSMGLGLYMTKMIIEKHMKGTIEVASTPREGTRFTICLYRQD
jgi:signal transduction histidine kinase